VFCGQAKALALPEFEDKQHTGADHREFAGIRRLLLRQVM
jgi:hypothetical protein